MADPACSLAFESEPEEPGLMRRPPRARGEPLFWRATMVLGNLGLLLVNRQQGRADALRAANPLF